MSAWHMYLIDVVDTLSTVFWCVGASGFVALVMLYICPFRHEWISPKQWKIIVGIYSFCLLFALLLPSKEVMEKILM